MEDNATATALSGAATPQDGVGTTQDTAHETDVDVEGLAAEASEDYHARNEQLRKRFLECNREIQRAKAAGDTAAEERARIERDRIGNEFIESNIKLAVHNSSSFLIGDVENRKDHLQSALLGAWEAFVGVDANKVDDVVVDEDGSVHAAAGWDPEKGTFATFAGRFISGQVRRSVQRVEAAYTGMKYNTWSEKPKVDRARRELTEELGRTPTLAEIAARAEVTIGTVRAVSTAAPVSLQTPVSDDGSATLGDKLADTAVDEDLVDMSALAEETFDELAREMAALDLMVLALRTGLTGRPALTVNRTADKLCVGRGSAQLAIKRALAALEPPEDPAAVPAPARCELCDVMYVYDPQSEPTLTLSEFDIPAGVEDLTLSQYSQVMAEWTAKVNEAHQREEAQYAEALVAHRTAARAEAARFVQEHRGHDGETEESPSRLEALLSAGQ